MLTSSGDIKRAYVTMGLVFGEFSREGGFGYEEALSRMTSVASQKGADAVIHIGFNERSTIGVRQVCFQNQTVSIFEVRCWGTMVRFE